MARTRHELNAPEIYGVNIFKDSRMQKMVSLNLWVIISDFF